MYKIMHQCPLATLSIKLIQHAFQRYSIGLICSVFIIIIFCVLDACIFLYKYAYISMYSLFGQSLDLSFKIQFLYFLFFLGCFFPSFFFFFVFLVCYNFQLYHNGITECCMCYFHFLRFIQVFHMAQYLVFLLLQKHLEVRSRCVYALTYVSM